MKKLLSSIFDSIYAANAHNENCIDLTCALGGEVLKTSVLKSSPRLRARLHRYTIDQGLF